MGRRRGWKRGEWLVKDEESDFVEYASEVAYDYWGTLKKKSQLDPAHPQLFIRAKSDPTPVYPQNPPVRTFDTSAYNLGDFVGSTAVTAPIGPATHIYNPGAVSEGNPGIGDMEIGVSFVVR